MRYAWEWGKTVYKEVEEKYARAHLYLRVEFNWSSDILVHLLCNGDPWWPICRDFLRNLNARLCKFTPEQLSTKQMLSALSLSVFDICKNRALRPNELLTAFGLPKILGEQLITNNESTATVMDPFENDFKPKEFKESSRLERTWLQHDLCI